MSHPNEDLIHAIYDTDLLPALVPEIVKIIKERIGAWHHAYGSTTTGQILIYASKEMFYANQAGAHVVGYVDVDVHHANIVCRVCDDHPKLILELQDPDCFKKLGNWLQRIKNINPWGKNRNPWEE